MKLSKIAALFMVPVLALCLVACSAPGGNASESASSDPKIAELTAQKPANADEAAELYAKLMQKENEIFSSDNALWEKVFNAANKDSAMIEDGSNYGDFLLKTIDGAKDEFTADELKTLKAGAQQIKEIEDKLESLEKEFPGCGSTPSAGESVDASTAGMTAGANASSEATKFPSFTGKDLDGNDVNSDELFSKNKVTVMNFWFTTCKPCVGELGDLESLNKELAEKGQQVTMESVLHDINERDRQDMNRAIAPLRQAEDAVLLDTSALTLEESIASVLRIIREKTEENK